MSCWNRFWRLTGITSALFTFLGLRLFLSQFILIVRSLGSGMHSDHLREIYFSPFVP